MLIKRLFTTVVASFIAIVGIMLGASTAVNECNTFVQTFTVSAANYPRPSLASGKYVVMVCNSKVDVFLDTSLRTPGSYLNGKAKYYGAYADAGDEIYVYTMTNSYCTISYPVTGGRRTGYVKPEAIFNCNETRDRVTSAAKVTTYKKSDMKTSYGYVSKNDSVYLVGKVGSNYRIIYNISNNNWKSAFVTESGWNSITNEGLPVTPLENGAYYWISPACATGSVVDISEVSYNDGANTHLWSKVSGTNQKNQQFKAVQKSNYYIFEAAHSGKAIDVCGAKTGNGQNVHQWTTHGGDNQCWYLYSAGNGYYYLKSKMNKGFCLDVNGASNANGTNIQLWEYNRTSAQKFNFSKVTYADNSTYPGYVNTSSQPLNLRSSAESGNNVIASMPRGSSLTVLDGKRQTNGFYRVKYNGLTGYASAQYISFTEIKSDGPVTNISAAAATYGVTGNALEALKSINTKYRSNVDNNGTTVLFFEGVGNNSSSSKRMNAMCVVVKNRQIKYIDKNSSTIPDYPFNPSKNDNTPMPTIKSGIYSFTTVNHRNSYAALNVNNASVVRFRSRSSYYFSSSTGINIHRRSSDSIAPSNAGWVNSAGCLIVGVTPGNSSTSSYARFAQAVGIINANSGATSKYQNSASGKVIVDRTYAKSYMSSIGYYDDAINKIG